MGPGPHPERGNRRGELTTRMREEGLPPEDVDFVVHTHLHGDHVGWNLDADGRPTFSSARYLAPKGGLGVFSTAGGSPRGSLCSREPSCPWSPWGLWTWWRGSIP